MLMKTVAYFFLICVIIGAIAWTFLSIASFYVKGIFAGIIVCGVAGGIFLGMIIDDAFHNGTGFPFIG